MSAKYGVYENATGVLWSVVPATKEKAEYEASLVDWGHIVVKVKIGRQLSNAFAAGRLAGINEMRSTP